MKNKTLFILFLIKIILTTCLWIIPLLFFPQTLINYLGFKILGSTIFIRLLGAAYMALISGYFSGIIEVCRNKVPGGIIVMGIISNGLACIILGMSFFAGIIREWGIFAKIYMFISFAATGILAISLLNIGFILFFKKRK